MKIVFVSDTHNMIDKMSFPEGDILVHAGDATGKGSPSEVQRFNEALGELNFKHIIFTPGNHDFLFQREPDTARKMMTNATVLMDEEVIIDNIKFYGSPWQPYFGGWAFNLRRGIQLKEKWALIPQDTDVLITHGPPFKILDEVDNFRKENTGCADLLDAVQKIKPKYHVFGHIHEGYGTLVQGDTTFINAASVDEKYRQVNDPIVFEV